VVTRGLAPQCAAPSEQLLLDSYHELHGLVGGVTRPQSVNFQHTDTNNTLTNPTQSHSEFPGRYDAAPHDLQIKSHGGFAAVFKWCFRIKIFPKLSQVCFSTTHVAFILNTIYKTRSKPLLKETNFYKMDFTRILFLQNYTCSVQKPRKRRNWS